MGYLRSLSSRTMYPVLLVVPPRSSTSELFGHSRNLIEEGLNLSHKMLRTRARPKVLLCETYEEAWEYFEKVRSQTSSGVISDIEFPRKGELDRTAGVQVDQTHPRPTPGYPDRVAIEHCGQRSSLALDLDAKFLLKGSEVLLHDLRRILGPVVRVR